MNRLPQPVLCQPSTGQMILLMGLLLAIQAAFLEAEQASDYYSVDNYPDVEKIDAHFHIRTVDTEFVARAAEDGFRFLNVVVHTADETELRKRHQAAWAQQQAHPDRVEVVVAFPLKGWDEPDWVERTLTFLRQAKSQGAIGVKIWKDVGMGFRDGMGDLVKVDNHQFDPVLNFMEQEGLRLMAHLGEPKNCWLPLDQMTVKNDRRYFGAHPEYHMYKHPDMPSYEDQLAARNRMLDKHPNLPFLGAHFGSLEWSVELLADFLDRYPAARVDTAARMGQIQYQSQNDPSKVRSFFIRYQDRILYGTDGGVQAPGQAKAASLQMQRRWLSDWTYFCTDQEQSVPELDLPVRGLKLPRAVVDKIYHGNARQLFPRAWSD
ncbi:MAG: amidohydrolase family protein [Limisphaerales bacterium]